MIAACGIGAIDAQVFVAGLYRLTSATVRL